MASSVGLQVAELSVEEARALLARQHVGRVAYAVRGNVDIEPISYSVNGDWIVGRTSVGTKLARLAQQPSCAFEVDEVAGLDDWRSVVVKGTFYLLDPVDGSPTVYRRALDSIRALEPEALSEADATPHRNIVFGIYMNEISGRCGRSASQAMAVCAS